MIRITPQPLPTGTNDVFVVTEEVTRKRAEMMLASSPGNRKCTRVDVYVKQMKEGKWKLVPDCIGIDEEGRLLNGHNRLEAVIKADAIVKMLVAYNIKRADMAMIDIGKKRTPGDILAFAFNNIDNYNNIAATVRLLVPYYRNNCEGLSARDTRLVTGADIADFVAANQDEIVALRFPHRIPFSPSAIMAACFVFNRIDVFDSRQFMECLKNSYNPYDGFPIKTLEKALVNLGARNDNNRIAAFAKAIKAWNFWRQNKACKQLKWLDSEPFPKPI